ncbi:BnaC03g56920D [Brassica napus]|uniref:BnaC03g56920D protein n=1 Tax=Brassica napus TaxID=3708 RepID=A0A078HA98_BRANA|nr:BnaC03g56920D [Brassica napus]
MEANLDPSSSGSLLQLRLRRLLACKAPRCRLETRCPLG